MSASSPAADGSKGVLFGDYSLAKNSQHVSILMTFRSRFPVPDMQSLIIWRLPTWIMPGSPMK